MQDSIARALALKFIKGKADLVNGKVPQDQLPSFVSDVVEVDTYTNLPQPGESGKIYVTTDTGNTYRWSGTQYVLVNEQGAYYSIKVDSTHITDMEALRNYITNINGLGLHCFFDFSDFKDNGYVCTVEMFTKNTKNYALIFDLINGKKYIDYEGYQDDELVSSYINRSGDDIPTIIKLTDDAIKVEELEDMLVEINNVDHHVLFDLSILCDGCYLCTISLDIPNKKVVISDVTSGKIARMTYTSSTLVTDVLDILNDLVDLSSAQTITGVKTFDNGVNGNNGQFTVMVNNQNSYRFGTIALRTYGNGVKDLGDATHKWKDLYLVGKIYGATQNASADDIINGITGMDGPTSTTLTDNQIARIIKGVKINGSLTISGVDCNGAIFYPAKDVGTYYRGKVVCFSANNVCETVYRIAKDTKVIDIINSVAVNLRNISRINDKSIPDYLNNQDGIYAYRNNGLVWLRDGIIQDTTHTTFSGALTSNVEYQFTQSLTALNIDGLDTTTGDNDPSWKIKFKVGSGFAFTSTPTLVWKDGTPAWSSLVGEEVEILIEPSLTSGSYLAWLI